MLIRLADDLAGHSAVFEDDGRAAYAYLPDEDEIAADVRSYNRVVPQQTLLV